jgi:ATP-dependent DNA helicase DinG
MMEKVYQLLKHTIKWPIHVQGQAPRQQLLDQFLQSDNSVLLGTSSFWEGVDVKGEALSCVIIDKLPFASPSDPVLKSKLKNSEEQGGNPFMDIQIPTRRWATDSIRIGSGRAGNLRSTYYGKILW